MQVFQKHRGKVAVLDRENIDTDQIIPKQHLKRIERTGFGQHLFSDWRLNPDGSSRHDFILNQDHAKSASILVTGRNFGCGSSREHAAWALMDYGFRVTIAPSYADIFRNNAGNNGLLTIELGEASIAHIKEQVDRKLTYQLEIDLGNLTVLDDSGWMVNFDCDPSRRHRLLHGLDEIGMTLAHEAAITQFEEARRRTATRLPA